MGFLVTPVEVITAQILVLRSVFDDVVGCRYDGRGDGNDRLLGTTSCADALKLRSEVRRLFFAHSRPGDLHDSGLSPLAFLRLRRAPFPVAFVLAWRKARPTHQVP